MAKKAAGSKGKDKKAARKAETERAAALKAQLAALTEEEWGPAAGDQLPARYPAFTRYDRRGIRTALRSYAAPAMPPALLDWALGLTRAHMEELYNSCPGPDWRWSDARKRAELAHPAARFLVAFQQPDEAPAETAAAAGQQQQQAQPPAAEAATEAAAAVGQGQGQENEAAAGNGAGAGTAAAGAAGAAGVAAAASAELPGTPVAFLHFRFEEEEGEAVLYCYEIQVAAAAQGKGLGRFLMQLFEFVGRRSGMARLMLTVFHANDAANALYKRLGYVLDEGSPGAIDPSGDHKYEIMTKLLPPPVAAAAAAK